MAFSIFQSDFFYSGGGLVTKSCPTFATAWTGACLAPLSMGFSRQGYWSGLPFPSPGDLSDPGIEPGSPALQADSLQTELQGKPHFIHTITLRYRPNKHHFSHFIEGKVETQLRNKPEISQVGSFQTRKRTLNSIMFSLC